MGESKKIVAASLKTKFNALKRLKGKLLKKKKKKVCSTSVRLGEHLKKYKNTAHSDLRKFNFFAPR